MKAPSILGLIGSLLLLIGCFAPIFELPVVGFVSLFQRGSLFGIIVVGTAVGAAILSIRERTDHLWVAALPPLFSIAYVSWRASRIARSLSDDQDKLAGLYQILFEFRLQYSWGVGVLLAGCLLLMIAPWSDPSTAPPRPPRKALAIISTGLAGGILVYLLGAIVSESQKTLLQEEAAAQKRLQEWREAVQLAKGIALREIEIKEEHEKARAQKELNSRRKAAAEKAALEAQRAQAERLIEEQRLKQEADRRQFAERAQRLREDHALAEKRAQEDEKRRTEMRLRLEVEMQSWHSQYMEKASPFKSALGSYVRAVRGEAAVPLNEASSTLQDEARKLVDWLSQGAPDSKVSDPLIQAARLLQRAAQASRNGRIAEANQLLRESEEKLAMFQRRLAPFGLSP